MVEDWHVAGGQRRRQLLGHYSGDESISFHHPWSRQKLYLPAKEQQDFIDLPLQNIRLLQNFGENIPSCVLPFPSLEVGGITHKAGHKPGRSAERNAVAEHELYILITKEFTCSKANSPTHRVFLCMRRRSWWPTRSICCGERNVWRNIHLSAGLHHVIMIFFLLW